METIDFNEVIRDPETISVVGGLLPGYPTNISHRAISDGVFYLKITGFLNGLKIIFVQLMGRNGL